MEEAPVPRRSHSRQRVRGPRVEISPAARKASPSLPDCPPGVNAMFMYWEGAPAGAVVAAGSPESVAVTTEYTSVHPFTSAESVDITTPDMSCDAVASGGAQGKGRWLKVTYSKTTGTRTLFWYVRTYTGMCVFTYSDTYDIPSCY